MSYHRLFQATLPVAVLILAGAVSAAQEAGLLHARVSYEGGGGLVKGPDDSEWSYAVTNSLILPGDTLWADKGGTMEIEFAGGNFLRMADGSKIEVKQVSPSLSLNGWLGSFYVQRVSRSTGDVTFRTPASVVDVKDDSHVRVDVLEDGSTTVSVRWGRAYVRTDVGSPVLLTGGMRTYIDPGLLPSTPMPFDKAAEDDFDAWCRERARLLALGDSAVPTTVAPAPATLGFRDLTAYGEWVTLDNTPYWRPTVVVNYVPYRYGHWSYVPAYGYNWVGDYPFCYVTSHYGRWSYKPAYGWLWCYDSAWSPAWCVTVRTGSRYMWCPVDFYGYPVSYGSASFTVGGVHFSIGASTYCNAADLYYGPCATYPVYGNYANDCDVTNVNIWNIYTGDYWNRQGRHRNPYSNLNSPMTVRNYAPQRVIRGPELRGNQSELASVRHRSLESSMSRTQFSSAQATGGRAIRTGTQSSNRSSQVRTASIERNVLNETTNTIERVQRRSSNSINAGASVVGSTARAGSTDRVSRSVRRTNTDSSDNPLPLGERITTLPGTTDSSDGRIVLRGRGRASEDTQEDRQNTEISRTIPRDSTSVSARERRITIDPNEVNANQNEPATDDAPSIRHTEPDSASSNDDGESGRVRQTTPRDNDREDGISRQVRDIVRNDDSGANNRSSSQTDDSPRVRQTVPPAETGNNTNQEVNRVTEISPRIRETVPDVDNSSRERSQRSSRITEVRPTLPSSVTRSTDDQPRLQTRRTLPSTYTSPRSIGPSTPQASVTTRSTNREISSPRISTPSARIQSPRMDTNSTPVNRYSPPVQSNRVTQYSAPVQRQAPSPRISTPSAQPRISTPQVSPRITTPSAQPRISVPQVSPRVQAPSTPRITAPSSPSFNRSVGVPSSRSSVNSNSATRGRSR
ncbi:MAG: hypothetical protein AMXMBFR84_22580 [Candidatus Hydrogenedentota bacterium]